MIISRFNARDLSRQVRHLIERNQVPNGWSIMGTVPGISKCSDSAQNLVHLRPVESLADHHAGPARLVGNLAFHRAEDESLAVEDVHRAVSYCGDHLFDVRLAPDPLLAHGHFGEQYSMTNGGVAIDGNSEAKLAKDVGMIGDHHLADCTQPQVGGTNQILVIGLVFIQQSFEVVALVHRVLVDDEEVASKLGDDKAQIELWKGQVEMLLAAGAAATRIRTYLANDTHLGEVTF